MNLTKMKKFIFILIGLIMLSCSNDDDIIVTQNNFPLGDYVDNNPAFKSSVFFFPTNSSRYVEGKLMGQYSILGLRVVGSPAFPTEGFVNNNILTIESDVAILKFKFTEYPDRYELTYHEAMIKSGAPSSFTLAYLYNMVFIQYKK